MNMKWDFVWILCMSEEQYMFYVEKAEALSKKLKEGYYFKSALKKAEEELCRLYQ